LRPPELLLLDEPFAALDIALRSRVRDELDALRERFAVPLVLISHDIEDVRRFADTLVLLGRDGVAEVVHRDEGDVEACAERFARDTIA
jgi:molybdate transport system ATP-binding protein